MRGKQARNFITNVPKILDLKSSSEQIFFENCRWVPLTLQNCFFQISDYSTVYTWFMKRQRVNFPWDLYWENKTYKLKVSIIPNPWHRPWNTWLWIVLSEDQTCLGFDSKTGNTIHAHKIAFLFVYKPGSTWLAQFPISSIVIFCFLKMSMCSYAGKAGWHIGWTNGVWQTRQRLSPSGRF